MKLRHDAMFMRTLPAIALLVALALSACAAPALDGDSAYVAEIDAWHREHVADMLSDTGQLTQVGLHHLWEGTWTIGSAEEADILLPERAPARLGEVSVVGSVVRFTAADDVAVHRFGSEPLQRVERVELTAPTPEGGPLTLVIDRLLFHVIHRGDVHLLRVRDQDSATRTDFEAPKRFAVDPRFRVPARLVPGTAAMQTMQLEGGLVSTSFTLGQIEFELDGQTCRLRPTFEPGGELFLVFADATTGTETYPGGRYLSAPPLDADGRTLLDFNRAYTPVCAWNAFSTCPRALPENTLEVAVRAGERYAKDA